LRDDTAIINSIANFQF